MNPAEECLKCLLNQDWPNLSKVLANPSNIRQMSENQATKIFERYLVDELKRYENGSSKDLHQVALRVFQIEDNKELPNIFSESGRLKLARYLFDKNPDEKYAEVLKDDPDAIKYLKKINRDKEHKSEVAKMSANLNIAIGEDGELQYSKSIFNSPQEIELFMAAQKVLKHSILLPNTALSTIIDYRVCDFLDSSTTEFFLKSTLDLCVVNSQTFKPELFIELDSSWHDKPKSIENDKKKDAIFSIAGLKLHRLRKKENKRMNEMFELFLRDIEIR